MSFSLWGKNNRLEGKHGVVHYKTIDQLTCARLAAIEVPRYRPEEFGWFGIDEKIILLQKNGERGKILASARQLDELEDILKQEIKKNSGNIEIHFERSMHGRSSIEITRGIFKTPWQEFQIDKIIREMMEAAAAKAQVIPLYSGKEHLTGTRSYGHHVHWSAGGPLETLLLYSSMRNELWRVTAFGANSPVFDKTVLWHSERLGNTFVTEVVPKTYKINQAAVRKMEPFSENVKKYPLLLDNSTGTLEVRASDIDPRSSATVAYITLLLRTEQQKIREQQSLAIYSDDLIYHNMMAAKRHGLSDHGRVEILREQEVGNVSIRQEMIRHYEQEILPILRQLQKGHDGKFIHRQQLEEIERRIYDGQTPAQRQIDRYQKVRHTGSHQQGLIAAQKLNFYTRKKYS